MITFVRETITHFLCDKCKKWFSISEWIKKNKIIVTCPHCNNACEPKESDKND